MSKLLEGLNNDQKLAVISINGTIQICSVAGSGKTRVLTHRVAYMLEQGINPSNIMVTTFSKKATEEMTQRLSALVPKMAMKQLTIGTTHSIGYRILVKEYNNLGLNLSKAFKQDMLMNGTQKIYMKDIHKAALKDFSLPRAVKQEIYDIAIPEVIKAISYAKNFGKYPRDMMREASASMNPKMQAIAYMFEKYEQQKERDCKIDVDDLLFKLVELFRQYPEVLAKYQRFYKYLLVDEAQDNNLLQYQIVESIALPQNNLFYVGDDDQSMYAFRGAQPEQFIKIEEKYSNMQRVNLQINYRSKPDILNKANLLIANNTIRLEKKLIPHHTSEEKAVFYHHYQGPDDEAEGVVEEVMALNKEGVQYKDMAVLMRTNAQSRALEDSLILAGIPYVIHGSTSFYERKEVKDILGYLQLAYDPKNDKAFDRIINVPNRYLGKAFINSLKVVKGTRLDALDQVNLKDYQKKGIQEFQEIIEVLQGLIKQKAPATEVIDTIMEMTRYEEYLRKEEGDEEDNPRMENINTLRYVVGKFNDVTKFLKYIDLMTSKAKTSINGVQLMTFHKSKGLEFPIVFNVGISEGILPHVRAIESGFKCIEEERRLGYVGVTRAQDKCFLSSISSFNDKPVFPSRFIREMKLEVGVEFNLADQVDGEVLEGLDVAKEELGIDEVYKEIWEEGA